MKIIIFSDSHGDVETMCYAVEKEKPDMIIHLGDCIADAEQLNERSPSISMIKVLGNMDSNSTDEELIKIADIYGKRFVITHGHTFINEWKDGRPTDGNRITSRINMLKTMAENNADILLHGHTHEPYINRTQVTQGKTCWIMNPGRIGRTTGGTVYPIYGVLAFNASKTFEWKFVELA